MAADRFKAGGKRSTRLTATYTTCHASTTPRLERSPIVISLRKKMRQLEVRPGQLVGLPAWARVQGGDSVGYANRSGATLGLVDPAEPDRITQLVVRNTDEAFAIMELMARFINERHDNRPINVATGRIPFHYQTAELDGIDAGPDLTQIHVQFDNRHEGFQSWPATTRHMSLPYSIFRIIRVAMSRLA